MILYVIINNDKYKMYTMKLAAYSFIKDMYKIEKKISFQLRAILV